MSQYVIEGTGRTVTLRVYRIFLLSPANAAGNRAKMLLRAEAKFDLAVRLRESGVSLGELYSFMSALYFRGKLAYAQAFASPPPNVPGIFIITPSHGLVRPETIVTLSDVREMSATQIDIGNVKYRVPLEQHARLLVNSFPPDLQVVLLGSIATQKYVSPLLDIFGERLMFPGTFVGRGDMSRGGLLLRCCRERDQLEYTQLTVTTKVSGSRPAKLPRLPRSRRTDNA